MKIYSIILLVATFFNACAHKSAFDDFNITQQQELSEEQLQSTKITNDKATTGIATVLYLNAIDTKKYKNHEYFYVYLYLDDKKNQNMHFLLNKQPAINVIEFKNDNQFTKLTNVNAAWLKYYLVEFNKSQKELRFEIKSNNNSSEPLLFKKED